LFISPMLPVRRYPPWADAVVLPVAVEPAPLPDPTPAVLPRPVGFAVPAVPAPAVDFARPTGRESAPLEPPDIVEPLTDTFVRMKSARLVPLVADRDDEPEVLAGPVPEASPD
jgi:hypothetical protein